MAVYPDVYNEPAGVLVLMPEEHVETIYSCAVDLHNGYTGKVPRNFSEQERMKACRTAAAELAKCASDILNYQHGVIRHPGVSTVYFETRRNPLTEKLYDGCMSGRKAVWMREPSPIEDSLRNRAYAGATDIFYEAAQKSWEAVDCIDAVMKNLPLEGTMGVVRIGNPHANHVKKSLENMECEVRTLPYLGYKERIDELLRSLNVDVNGIRASAEINANF